MSHPLATRAPRTLPALFALLIAASTPLCAGETERQGLRLAPKAFRAAVDKVLPSVVTIETYGGVSPGSGPAPGGRRGGGGGGINKPGDGPTTGMIISPDGYIVTSTFNFIRKPPVITVVLRDGTQKVAQLLGRDETRKLCLLKIEGVKDLPVPQMAAREQLRVGQWAVTVGVGYGDADPAISAGIVSATSRISGRAVQTDANISPANYGGPLVDIDGRVIGVCVPLTPQSKETAGGVEWYDSGIGFAVPLSGAENILAAMKAGKTVEPGQMGVQLKAAEADGRGALVEKVVDKSPAAKAGIQPGDRIEKIADAAVLDVPHVMSLMGRYVAGDRVTVHLKRGDKSLSVEMTLEKVPIPPPTPPMPTPKPTPPNGKPAPKDAPQPPEPSDGK